jgi:hypothetical protein
MNPVAVDDGAGIADPLFERRAAEDGTSLRHAPNAK